MARTLWRAERIGNGAVARGETAKRKTPVGEEVDGRFS